MVKVFGKELLSLTGDELFQLTTEELLTYPPLERNEIARHAEHLVKLRQLEIEMAHTQFERGKLRKEAREREEERSKTIWQAMERLARLEGVPGGAGGNPLPPEAAQAWNEPSFLTRFFADRPMSDRTKDSYGAVFEEFAEVLAEPKALKDIRKADVKRYAEYLRDRPSSRGGRLDRETIKKNLSHLRAYFGWHTEAGYLLDNPAEGVNPPREARAVNPDQQAARRAFREDELRILFHSPLFTGCKSKGRLSQPGANVYKNERYWFWLTMLLTGARLEEIATAPSKLASVGDVLCLDLRHATKTQNAPRLIPIIPDLQAVGFVDWCDEQQRRGRRLVEGPDAPEDWSKWLNRYLDDIGLDDKSLVFYSLRHNFRQQLRGSGLHPEIIDKIFGHEGQAVGGGYGRELSPAEARKVVELVRSPVSLGHL